MSELSNIATKAVNDAKAEVEKVAQRVNELEGKVAEKIASLEQDVEELVGLKTKLTPAQPAADPAPQLEESPVEQPEA